MVRELAVMVTRRLERRNRAQAMVEYALILVLVAVVVIAALVALGGSISGTFEKITNSLK